MSAFQNHFPPQRLRVAVAHEREDLRHARLVASLAHHARREHPVQQGDLPAEPHLARTREFHAVGEDARAEEIHAPRRAVQTARRLEFKIKRLTQESRHILHQSTQFVMPAEHEDIIHVAHVAD